MKHMLMLSARSFQPSFTWLHVKRRRLFFSKMIIDESVRKENYSGKYHEKSFVIGRMIQKEQNHSLEFLFCPMFCFLQARRKNSQFFLASLLLFLSLLNTNTFSLRFFRRTHKYKAYFFSLSLSLICMDEEKATYTIHTSTSF